MTGVFRYSSERIKKLYQNVISFIMSGLVCCETDKLFEKVLTAHDLSSSKIGEIMF